LFGFRIVLGAAHCRVGPKALAKRMPSPALGPSGFRFRTRRQSTVKATTGVSRLRSNLACSTCSGRGPAEWPLHAPRWPLAPPQRLGIRFDHSRPQVRPHDARAHTRVLLALFVTAKASREMDLKALGCRRFCFHVEPTQPPGDVGQKRRFCTLAEVSV
jgi:hypothetical protein